MLCYDTIVSPITLIRSVYVYVYVYASVALVLFSRTQGRRQSSLMSAQSKERKE